MESSLVHGIVVLIIGIILYAVSRVLPPGVSTAAYWIGIVLMVIGAILIVLAILGVSLGGLLVLPPMLL